MQTPVNSAGLGGPEQGRGTVGQKGDALKSRVRDCLRLKFQGWARVERREKESQRDELTTPEQPLFWETRTERPEITILIIIIKVRIVQNISRTFLSLSLTNNMLLSGVMSVITSKAFSTGTRIVPKVVDRSKAVLVHTLYLPSLSRRPCPHSPDEAGMTCTICISPPGESSSHHQNLHRPYSNS